jgi:hypothetical protein
MMQNAKQISKMAVEITDSNNRRRELKKSGFTSEYQLNLFANLDQNWGIQAVNNEAAGSISQ